jgi:hypothetical protein
MRIAKLLEEAVTSLPETGTGVCATKIVWLAAGLTGVVTAFIVTIMGCVDYYKTQKADPVYWTAVSALWVNIFAFVSSTKKHDFEQKCRVVSNRKEDTDGPKD